MSGGSGARASLRLEELAVRPGPALAAADLPPLAVVIPTLDGKRDLSGCLEALGRQDYPAERLSIVVVDNGSRDGTRELLASDHARVRVVANETNLGFAVATNQGARAANGAKVLVFLNNDVRVEAGFLRELAAPIARGECAATSAKVLSWDGSKIDHAGGGSNLQGIAIAHGYGEAPGPEHGYPRRCLFACGGAMAMDAALFHRLGGFDEEYFAYYEDLDLGWRTWIAGGEVHYVPSAVCIHRHSGTSRRFPPEVLRVLQARNPLLTAFKNYGDANLQRLLPAILALHLRRAWVMGRMGEARGFRVDGTSHLHGNGWRRLLQRLRPGHGRARVGKLAVSDLVAANDLLERFDHWVERRRAVQATRARDDAEIFLLFLKPFWCVEQESTYARLQESLIGFLGLAELFEGTTIAGPEPKG